MDTLVLATVGLMMLPFVGMLGLVAEACGVKIEFNEETDNA
jgi:hypothetical protein